MKLDVHTHEWSDEMDVLQWHRQPTGIKFVVVDHNGTRTVRIAAPEWCTHSDLVHTQDGEVAVGGGSFARGRANWGSGTLRGQYTFDRPRDAEEATRVLTEVQKEIAAWIADQLKSQ